MNGVNLLQLFLVSSKLLGEKDVVSVLVVGLSDFVAWQLFMLMGHAIILHKFEHIVISLVEKDIILKMKSRNVLSLVADVQESLVNYEVHLKLHIVLVVELDVFDERLVRECIGLKGFDDWNTSLG